MTNWYDKYTNIPYKHLGNDPNSGMDCYNLCRYVYEKETNISIPYISYEHCNIIDEDWYNKTTEQYFENIAKSDIRWTKVSNPKPFDFIIMSIGGTNVTNHCALYVDYNKILHCMQNRVSWIAPYGSYYKQYTTGIYRWTT
jgi:cell wall-associated NlpC family hydrolase